MGAVYTWNTAGSIAGTLLASFALIPAVGLSATIKIAATVNLAVAAWLSWISLQSLLQALKLRLHQCPLCHP